MLTGQPLAVTPFLQEVLEDKGRVGSFLLLSRLGWGSGAGVCSAAGALRGKFTQDPRATGLKPPEEQRHQAKHTMPPGVTGRVIGFHRFSMGRIFAYN